MATKYILETSKGYAKYDFTNDDWRTTESLADESDLLIIEAADLEAAIAQAGELVGGIRYRRHESATLQNEQLHSFTVLVLDSARAQEAGE